MATYLQRLYGVVQPLIEPPPTIQPAERSSRLRLLNALMLVLIVFAVLTLLAIGFSDFSTITNPQSDFYDTLLGVGMLVGIYLISRSGRYMLAAGLLVGAAIAMVVMMGIPYDTLLLADMLYYLVVPVLLASLLFNQRTSLLVTAATLIVISLLPLFYPALNLFDLLYGQGAFILVVSLIIWLMGYYRNRLENTRQLQLRNSEAQLREYTDQLETRVQERTAELERAKERAEAVLFHSSDAVILTHADGTIQQTNPAFDKLFGYMQDELFGKPLDVLVDRDGSFKLDDAVQHLKNANTVARLEVMGRRNDGTTFPADVLLSTVVGAEEGIMVCSLRDISSLKAKENSLREALEREHEMHEMKARLVTAVSHEFRTPLAIIYSSSDLLKIYGDRLTETRKQEHIQAIQDQVDHITTMLEDILTLGRAGSADLWPEDEPTGMD